MHAQQRDAKRIDFVSQLPVEIALTTLIPMFMDKDDPLDANPPCPYLYVSKLWRNRIIQCIGGLDFVIDLDDVNQYIGILGTTMGEKYQADTFARVITFAQHTKSLTIKWYHHGIRLGGLLQENSFCSLRELHMECKLHLIVYHNLLTLGYIRYHGRSH